MGFFEVGHWAVTTTDDANGEYDGLDPHDADLGDRVWAVYDIRCDDEPLAAGMTNQAARQVATALNLLDTVSPLLAPWLAPITDEFGEPQPDPYAGVESKGYFVVCCKACDGGRVLPMPFDTEAKRTEWVTGHTLGTGHTHYHLVNPTPVEPEPIPLDFGQVREVNLGSIAISPGVSGMATEPAPRVLTRGRIQALDGEGRPVGESIEVGVRLDPARPLTDYPPTYLATEGDDRDPQA